MQSLVYHLSLYKAAEEVASGEGSIVAIDDKEIEIQPQPAQLIDKKELYAGITPNPKHSIIYERN